VGGDRRWVNPCHRDGGRTWRKIQSVPGVPERTYVSCLTASRHATNTVYAAFDNHKNGDFKPYLFQSTDLGSNWVSVVGNLPSRDFVLTLQEDHQKADLLFVGTEFGAWFTLDGAKHWLKVAGLRPSLSVTSRSSAGKTISSSARLAVASMSWTTTPLCGPLPPLSPIKRRISLPSKMPGAMSNAVGWVGSTAAAGKEQRIMPPPTHLWAPSSRITCATNSRPEKRKRQETEAKDRDAGKSYRQPPVDELREEDREKEPQVWLVVRDEAGQ